MLETFTRWDAAEHLSTKEDPVDGSLIRAALNDIARARNMSLLARDVGMSREGLYKALSENGPQLLHGDADHAGTGHAVASYGVGEFDLSQARVVMPPSRQAISVRIDRDVMDFFKSQGRGYQTRINAVLRSYMEAKQGGWVSHRTGRRRYA